MIINNEQKNLIEKLIRESAEIMLSASRVENDASNIKAKAGDADFVTVFDEAVQANLIKGLSALYPDAHFFAEEKENFSEETANGICFVIDPIDGTTNFIHSLNASTISVAMLYNGEAVYGAVYDPYRDEFFYAVKGEGAFCNGCSVSVSDRDLPLSVIAFGTTPYKKKEYSEKGFAAAHRVFMNCADIRRSGSAALDMAYVACGKLDGFFECVLSPWDYAAGYILVKEAGGEVTDFVGNATVFDKPAPILCSNTKIHTKLLALINKK